MYLSTCLAKDPQYACCTDSEHDERALSTLDVRHDQKDGFMLRQRRQFSFDMRTTETAPERPLQRSFAGSELPQGSVRAYIAAG